MRIIGITGGVGAGKSAVLTYIQNNYNCRVILADEVGHLVKRPGETCYNKLVELLGNDILLPDNTIDKVKMAEKIFADSILLKSVNDLIHPAVETYIKKQIETEKVLGNLDFFFVEAALLLESALHLFMDEIWYIHADEAVRRKRLKEARQYSDEKIDSIMKSQKKSQEFMEKCDIIIYNNDDLEMTKKQIDEKLGAYL